MAVPSPLHMPWENTNSSLPSAIPALPRSLNLTANPVPYAITAILVLAVIISVNVHSSFRNGHKKIPIFNPKRAFELTATRARGEFDMRSWDMMYQGGKKYPDQAFQALTAEIADAVILPPRYINEIKNDSRFSFTATLLKAFHGDMPGFVAFGIFNQPNRIIQYMAQQDLTRSIQKLSGALSRETDAALTEMITDSTAWHEMVAKDIVLPLIARLTTLVFMGPDICHNKEWINISIYFTIQSFLAGRDLAVWPRWMRPFANLYLVSQCRALRALEAKARQIIDSELEKRRALKAEAEKNEVELEFHDALEWYEKQYSKLGGVYDPTATQLGLTFVALHTTTDLLTQVILDLAEHQELFEPLRNEITDCLKEEGGISKLTIHNMQLLDSVIKESQRVKPVQVAAMQRVVLEDVTLSDGIHLKRGSMTGILPQLRDPMVYENPDEFDGYRFYRLRQTPGKANNKWKTAQLVTTSPEHTGFGHGQHACPGRFFAAHEVKIALCHLLLKYEWKIPEGGAKPQWRAHGNTMNCDDLAKIAIRRREAGEAEALL
ncbi:Fumitremorgin C monooxygenase [Cytospora mali]|uniref:Fumitremorgin C monooxygenase n=1 Tax=Cytospora mali TaxID=578113 RepID=A0A194V1S2_CYTMA|nr:Fumitremorgin C monooxygenase [Valsa mali var. pyri (nom. inval.)]